MSKREQIAAYVGRKITFLSEGSDSFAGAELAKLRRGVGKIPGEKPDLYGFFLQDMPEEFWRLNGNASAEEWACYLAVTMYSLHQQGNSLKTHNLHTSAEGESLGRALGRLAMAQGDSNAGERMQKKLQMVITSNDIGEFSHHLKGIIMLLKSEGISLNYMELAQDIYDFQFEESKVKVSLRWGQDFFRKEKGKEDE